MLRERYKPTPFVDTAGLTREEWLEYRKHGFGASDMPAVMEQSEYQSVLALFHEKVSRRPKEELDQMVAERIKRESEEGPPTPPMFDDQPLIIDPGAEFNLPAECGLALEPVIAKHLSIKLGVPVYKDTVMYQHPHYPFLMATLDYMAICPDPETGEMNRRVIVECKNVTRWKEDDISFGPLYAHIIQCRAQMCVMNADEVIIAYLCDNNDGGFHVYRIYRDYGKEAELIQTAKNLWNNHVAKEVLPIPTVSTDAAWRELADYAFSGRRYELAQEYSGQKLMELTGRYIEAKRATDDYGNVFDDSKAELEQLQLQLAPYLFDQKKVVCGDLILRWKQRASRSMDYDSFKLAHPLLYAQFVTEKVSTSFEAKVKKSAIVKESDAA